MASGPRIAAFALLAAFLAIAGTFMAIVLFGPKEPDAGVRQDAGELVALEERDGGLIFRGKAGNWDIEGRMSLEPSRSFRLRLAIADGQGRSAPSWVRPSLQFHMTEHVMEPVVPPVVNSASGLYQAEGSLPMAGRWRMRIGLPDGVLAFVVNVRG